MSNKLIKNYGTTSELATLTTVPFFEKEGDICWIYGLDENFRYGVIIKIERDPDKYVNNMWVLPLNKIGNFLLKLDHIWTWINKKF